VRHGAEDLVADMNGRLRRLGALLGVRELGGVAIADHTEAPLSRLTPLPTPVAGGDPEGVVAWAQVGVAREAVALRRRPRILQAHQLRAIHHLRGRHKRDRAIVDHEIVVAVLDLQAIGHLCRAPHDAGTGQEYRARRYHRRDRAGGDYRGALGRPDPQAVLLVEPQHPLLARLAREAVRPAQRDARARRREEARQPARRAEPQGTLPIERARDERVAWQAIGHGPHAADAVASAIHAEQPSPLGRPPELTVRPQRQPADRAVGQALVGPDDRLHDTAPGIDADQAAAERPGPEPTTPIQTQRGDMLTRQALRRRQVVPYVAAPRVHAHQAGAERPSPEPPRGVVQHATYGVDRFPMPQYLPGRGIQAVETPIAPGHPHAPGSVAMRGPHACLGQHGRQGRG